MSLKRHERIHTGGKALKWKKCDKCVKERGNLKNHERIHTGEKPFKCKQCDKCFNPRGNLKIHERIHIGEKPFKCKQCDLCFRLHSHGAGRIFDRLKIHTLTGSVHTEPS